MFPSELRTSVERVGRASVVSIRHEAKRRGRKHIYLCLEGFGRSSPIF